MHAALVTMSPLTFHPCRMFFIICETCLLSYYVFPCFPLFGDHTACTDWISGRPGVLETFRSQKERGGSKKLRKRGGRKLAV